MRELIYRECLAYHPRALKEYLAAQSREAVDAAAAAATVHVAGQERASATTSGRGSPLDNYRRTFGRLPSDRPPLVGAGNTAPAVLRDRCPSAGACDDSARVKSSGSQWGQTLVRAASLTSRGRLRDAYDAVHEYY